MTNVTSQNKKTFLQHSFGQMIRISVNCICALTIGRACISTLTKLGRSASFMDYSADPGHLCNKSYKSYQHRVAGDGPLRGDLLREVLLRQPLRETRRDIPACCQLVLPGNVTPKYKYATQQVCCIWYVHDRCVWQSTHDFASTTRVTICCTWIQVNWLKYEHKKGS